MHFLDYYQVARQLLPVRRVLCLSLIVFAAFIQGCASAPPAEAPLAPITLPEQFSATGETVLPQQWWQSFQDPVLDQLQDQALTRNFTLAAARARLRQARALSIQVGAAGVPSLDGSSQVGVERDNNGTTARRYGLGLAASYEVDLWGRIEAGIRAAEAEERAVAADLQTAAISLTAELASTYFELQQQEAILDLLIEQAQTNQDIAELIRLRLLSGQADLSELLRQRQLVAQSESQLLQARAQAELLAQQLAVLSGYTPDAELPIDEENEAFLPPLPATGLPAEWLRLRPDMVAAFARLEAADAEVAQAVSAQYPRLNLGVSLETAATSPSALFDSWFTSLTASLAAPLLDGGSRRAQVSLALATRDQALANYRQTVLESLQEVEAALLAERRDLGLLESITEQLELARAALEQLTFRYRNGAADYLDVLSTLTSVQSLQRERVALLYQRLQDRISLNRALVGNFILDANTQPDTEEPRD